MHFEHAIILQRRNAARLYRRRGGIEMDEPQGASRERADKALASIARSVRRHRLNTAGIGPDADDRLAITHARFHRARHGLGQALIAARDRHCAAARTRHQFGIFGDVPPHHRAQVIARIAVTRVGRIGEAELFGRPTFGRQER
jgi:hypothetical protein